MKDYITAKERLSNPRKRKWIESICYSTLISGLVVLVVFQLPIH